MQKLYMLHETEWNKHVQTLPIHHILQSWEWGDFKSRWGWKPTRILWRNPEPVAAAQILRRPIPYTPFGIAYVSKGPLLNADQISLAEQVLNDLQAEARRQRCLFVKIDADILASNEGFVTLLKERGWCPGEPIQFPNTGIIDLAPTEEQLLKAMKSKTRYNIRLSARRGVEVRDGSANQFELFYEMYAETAARDGFLIRPRDYYLDVWRHFHTKGLAHLLLAYVEEEAVAGIILFRFGERVWYFYGASTCKQRDTMPNYALQWAAIQWSKKQGASEYDLWGAPTNLEHTDDEMAGVWRFKTGFNAQFREQIGAWDYPTISISYKLYTRWLPYIRQRVGRR